MRVDHVAYRTRDTKATHDFYVGVMGWPLRAAFGKHDAEPPWLITGYDTGAFMLEFEEEQGVDGDTVRDVVFPHIGVEVEDAAAIDMWKRRLDDAGVPYGQFGDDVWLIDPNGVKIQLFVRKEPLPPLDERVGTAEANLAAWLAR